MFKSLRGLSTSQLLVAGTAFALPLIHSSTVYRHFVGPQLSFLVLVSAGASAAAIVGGLSWWRRESTPVRWSLVLAWSFVAWLALATVAGLDPMRSLLGEDSRGTGLLLWVAAVALFHLTLSQRHVLVPVVLTALRSAAATAVVLFAMWATGGDPVQSTFVPVSQAGVPLAGVGNPALLAAFLGAGLLAILAAPPGKRWWWVPVAGGLGVYLMVCENRIATATTGLAVLFTAVLLIRRGHDRAKVLSVVLAAAVGMGAGFFWVAPAVKKKAEARLARIENRDPREEEAAATRFTREGVVGGLRIRQVIWGGALDVVGSQPLKGVGPANLSLVFPRHVSREQVVETGLARFQVDDAHNVALEAGVAGGIPAVLLLVGWAVATGAAVSRKAPDHPPTGKRSQKKAADADHGHRDLLVVVRMGAAVLAFQHLFQPVSLSNTPLTMVLIALSVPALTTDARGVVAGWRYAIAGVAFIAGLVLAGSLLASEWMLSRGSLEWDRDTLALAAKLNPTCQVCRFELGKVRRWDHAREGAMDAAWAMEPNLRAVSEHPLDDEAKVQLGGGYLFLKEPRKALEPLQGAYRLNPYSTLALRGLAVAYLRLEEPERAIPYLEDLTEIAPSFESFDLLATAATEAGRRDLAEDASDRARRLAPKTQGTGPTKR